MKFKKGKKVLSLVLAALMVLSVMPTSMLIQKANAATAFEGGKEVADGTWKGWTWSVFGNSTAVANNTIKENSDGSVTLESSGKKGKIASKNEGIDFLYYKIENGKDFTITSSTAFDQKWINGKNTYHSISNVVDEIFNSYLSRPEVIQPILTQYCDGKKVSCPEFMSQWGSKALGDDGLSAIEILRYYYGEDMYINEAETISGVPASYPGYELTNGTSGPKVRQIQEQLNVIAGDYPLIPKIKVDGIYGPATANSVKVFQKIFHLPQTGVVDFATWYKISQIYVAVSRIAELT